MRVGQRCVLIGALASVNALSGCGGDGSRASTPAGKPQAPGGSGRLVYAVAALPADLDPLGARTLAAETVSRQIFEPLTASLDGPYGRRRNVPGETLKSTHSGDFRVWTMRLRPGVRFQDGRLLDASAVLANASRWRASPVGQALLPGFVAADGPRPDLVRFVFSEPITDLPSRLSDPRLGLVSPDALQPSIVGSSLVRAKQAGAGPFELVARHGRALLLRRNRGWWGSRGGLGPALDSIQFRVAVSPAERLALLRGDSVRVASQIGEAAARRLRHDPLLTVVGSASPNAIGLERSVRGIDGWRPSSLSSVWLTDVRG